jgi:hypothetical protein
MANGSDKKKKSKGNGSISAGFIMIGTGLVFLLSNMGVIPGIDETWPLFLIIVGASLLIGALRDRNAPDPVTPIAPPEPTPPAPIN